METPIKVFEHEGFHVEVHYDPSPENPRTWSNEGTMVYFHRYYSLGDTHSFRDPEDFQKWLKEQEEEIVSLPLYLYDHSGITISLRPSCPWDSGQVGWIYARKTADNSSTIEDVLKAEVRVYDQYLRGDIYTWTISDPEDPDETLDSCGGIYGYDSAEIEAKAAIESIANHRRHGHELLLARFPALREFDSGSGELSRAFKKLAYLIIKKAGEPEGPSGINRALQNLLQAKKKVCK